MRWDALDKRIERYAAEVKSTDLLKELIAAQEESAKAYAHAQKLHERYLKTLDND